MRKGIDLSAATKAERVVLGFGAAAFVNALMPWWYRITTARQTFLHNGGLYGWGTLAALAGFAAGAAVVARHSRVPPVFDDRALYATLGTIAVAALAIHGARSHAGLWIGFWFEAALALGLAAAGVARVRERRRGWV